MIEDKELDARALERIMTSTLRFLKPEDWEVYKRSGDRMPPAGFDVLLEYFLKMEESYSVMNAYAAARFLVDDSRFIQRIAIDNPDTVRKLSRICIQAGAYDDVLRVKKHCINTNVWNAKLSVTNRLEIEFDCAKAYRNMGDFTGAVDAYSHAADIALNNDLEVHLIRSILLLSKLFGLYRGQRGAYAYLAQVAMQQFRRIEERSSGKDQQSAIRYQAICCDAIGQAIREAPDKDDALKFFQQAVGLHAKAGNEQGRIRALSHVLALEFYRCQERNDQVAMKSLIERFKRECVLPFTLNRGYQGDGNLILLQDKLGAGIRYIQYGIMLDALKDYDNALEWVEEGFKVARKFSHYRMTVRALTAMAQIRIKGKGDQEKAFDHLQEAREICIDRKLSVAEIDTNLKIVDFYHYTYGKDATEETYETIKATSDQFITLSDEIAKRESWQLLDAISEKARKKGFADFDVNLTELSWRLFLDYEQLTRKLVKTLSLVVDMFKSNLQIPSNER